MVDALRQDVRYALRSFRASPGLTLVVVLTLGLSVGANAALFSVLNALVIRRLPVREPDRLAMIAVENDKGVPQAAIYVGTFQAFMAQQHAFEAGALYTAGGQLAANVRDGLVDGSLEGITADYFHVLGVRPLIGRLISAEDGPADENGSSVVVLSHQFWRRQLGSDPNVIGERLTISGVPLTIIGVTPPEFGGLRVDAGVDFMMPLRVVRNTSGDPRLPPRGYQVVGRLRPGVSIEQARAEVAATWPTLQAATLPAGLTPAQLDQMRSLHPTVNPIGTGFSSLRDRYASPLTMLVGLAGVLLAVGCANLSGLLLARAVARSGQMSVRIALGATRGRLIQQVAVEALLLSAAGTAFALPLAFWGSRLFASTVWISASQPLRVSVTPDARVFAVATAVAIAAGLLVCVLPAWWTTGQRASVDLTSARSTRSSITRSGRMLLVVQVALSLMLVFGAGLFARSLVRLRGNDAQFDTRRIVWGRLWLKPGKRLAIDDADGTGVGAAYYRDLIERLSQVQGVESIGMSFMFPANMNSPSRPEPFTRTESADAASDVDALVETVSPSFFDTIGVARLRGRDFTWTDDRRRQAVAIVNARLASRLFPDGDAVGRTIRASRDPTRQPIAIVGVVTDAPVGNLRDAEALVVYRPLLQDPVRVRLPIVNIRTRGDAQATTRAFAQIVGAAGPHYVRNALTLESQVDDSTIQERLLAWVASTFAGLAVGIACIGLYGFLAYSVARRTREIGVRMALGASRQAVHRLVLWDGCSLALAGVGLGIPCALLVAPVTRSLLYGIAPIDLPTLLGAGTIFIVVAVAACWIPALRASSVDPMYALRQE